MDKCKCKYKLGFIGAGNMAKAIAKGIVDNNIISADKIIMSDPYAANEYCNIKCEHDIVSIIDKCEYIIIAVKPQIYKEIKSELGAIKCECVISIMAGINLDDLNATFVNAANVVRVMPNSPSMVGSGMTAIADNRSANNHKDFLNGVFGAIGEYVYLDEKDFDTVTAISGSGPAYFYMFMDAMINAAISYGINEETAKKLVCGTAKGATRMIEQSTQSTQSLIEAVCSKGGTTIQAVNHFNDNQLYTIVNGAVKKARDRSIELSK